MTTTVHWKCGYQPCGHEFQTETLTREEWLKTPWRWCPKCHASAIATAVHISEGTFKRWPNIDALDDLTVLPDGT